MWQQGYQLSTDTLLSSQSVIRTDHLEVERGADPHGVGIDQFLADVGAWGLTSVLRNQGRNSCFGLNLTDKLGCLFVCQPQRRSMAVLAPCRMVQVVQAVAALAVLTDGDVVDSSTKGMGQLRHLLSRPLVQLDGLSGLSLDVS